MMNPAIDYSEVMELCLEKDPNHWISNEDIDLQDNDEVIELIQTGSVTTTIAGKKYVVELVVREAL